jgi:membrane protein
MKIKDIWQLVRDTFKEWSEDKAPRLAAALSYYTVFSIPPLLFMVISIAGLILNEREVRQAILDQIASALTQETAEAVGAMIDAASLGERSGIAAVIGLAILLLGASGVFTQLQDALNTIFEVRLKPGKLIFLLQKRLLSFLMVLVLGFLLLVSLVLSTALAVLAQYIQAWLPGSRTVFQAVNFLLPFLVIMVLFALMFRYIPDAKIAWRDVWPGAALTSLLFNIGKILLSLYLARSSVASTYGAAASVVLIFVWIYYTAQILFIGAEFTQVYANRFGAGIQPGPHAELLSERERAQQGIARK